MKFYFGFFITSFFLCSCGAFVSKEDIVTAVTGKEKLREDIYLLKRIVQKAHAGAYTYNSPAQIEFLFDSIYNSIDVSMTIKDFYNKVDYAIDRLGCIHSSAALPGVYYDSISDRALFFPIPMIVINDRVYVNSKAYTVPLGSEVVAINDEPILNLVKKLSVYKHTDGYSNPIRNSAVDDDFAINYYLAYGPYKKFALQYYDTASKKLQQTNVTAETLKDINDNMYSDTWYFFPTDAPYDFEVLDDKSTAVLTVRSFSFKTYATSTAFSHFLENSFRIIYQNNIQNLIIDCRSNGGGQYSNTYPLLCYLLNSSIKEYDSSTRRFEKLPYPELLAAEDTSRISDEDTTWKVFTKQNNDLYTENDDQVTLWEPSNIAFKGKLFVITNAYVASAASNFVSILKEQTNAYIVGDETAGNSVVHNAYTFTYELPNTHIKVTIPTRKYYQPVKETLHGRGVTPHKQMTYTIDDVINNTDRPLNYILDSLIRKK